MGDWFVELVIKRATHANVVLPCPHPIASSLAFLFEISRRISGCCISDATTKDKNIDFDEYIDT